MWIMIILLSLGLTLLGAVYLMGRFSRFAIVQRISGNRKRMRWLLGSLPVIGFLIYGIFDAVNSVVVLLHLVAF